MPANVYESLIMLDTSKMAGDLPATVQQLHAIMERNHAEILASRPWDERRLTYPIRGQKKALYYLLYFKTTGESLVAIEHDFQLNETVLRAMTLRIDPKWHDAILQVAREDTGNGFALRGMHEEASATTDPAALGGEGGIGVEGEMAGVGGGPRRGRRDHPEKPE